MTRVIIDKLDHYGRGMTRLNNIPIFIDNCLPTEEVEIKITKEKKKFLEGIVINYLKLSSLRIDPKCPYYSLCGGCDIMHMSYLEQLKFKENKIREIITKFIGLDILIRPIISSNQFNYRNKITLQVNNTIGLYKKKSSDIVNIKECLISSEKTTDIINCLSNINLTNILQIVIRQSELETMLVIHISGDVDKQEIIKKFKNIDSIILVKNGHENCIHGKSKICDEIKNYKFVISPQSFFQVNKNGMINLYDKVIECCDFKGNEKVLDLYCGTGTIGIYISKYCNYVLGIEINARAVKDALENKKINGIDNIDFECGDVSKILNIKEFKPDIVIVDPPRSGLDVNTVNKLLEFEINKIVYVSCDPITLARDLKLLSLKYNISEITPVDMFANTHHVECVVLLEKNKT